MYTKEMFMEPVSYPDIPVLDEDFDQLEYNQDISTILRELEIDAFYDDMIDLPDW